MATVVCLIRQCFHTSCFSVYSTSVTEASKWDLLLQLLFSHIFAMTNGSRCFHASGPIGSARVPFFLAEYAEKCFSIFATCFTFWPVFWKWESAKWDLLIGNATHIFNFFTFKRWFRFYLCDKFSVDLAVYDVVFTDLCRLWQTTFFYFFKMFYTYLRLNSQTESVSRGNSFGCFILFAFVQPSLFLFFFFF